MAEASLSEKFPTFMRLSDDGYLLLGEDGVIIGMNEEAGRMIGVDPADHSGSPIGTLPIGSPAWQRLLENCTQGRRSDIALSLRGGRRVLASLRREPHARHIELIKLCDLDVFDYRRDVAQGTKQDIVTGFMSNNRTRPDFEVQRTLSAELHRVLSRGERAIQQGARILITGESGVGKSEIARFLHNGVARANDPFVTVNCAVASAADLADGLFGDGRGRDGALLEAVGGTLFLDEIAEVPLSLQARLVGFLEDGILEAVKGNAIMGAGPRLITATNRDLRALVKEGRFRADLYYRIAVVGLSIPLLRELSPLIPHLTDRFLQTLNHRRKVPVVLPDAFRKVLLGYSFPGNIRELLNIVQRAVVSVEDAADMDELMSELMAVDAERALAGAAGTAGLDLKSEVRRFERGLIDKAIQIHGSKRRAAKALGVDIGTVVRKTTANP